MVGEIWGQSPLVVALSHTSLAEPRSEGVALRFPAGTQTHTPRLHTWPRTSTATGAEPMHTLTLAHTDTAQPRKG